MPLQEELSNGRNQLSSDWGKWLEAERTAAESPMVGQQPGDKVHKAEPGLCEGSGRSLNFMQSVSIWRENKQCKALAGSSQLGFQSSQERRLWLGKGCNYNCGERFGYNLEIELTDHADGSDVGGPRKRSQERRDQDFNWSHIGLSYPSQDPSPSNYLAYYLTWKKRSSQKFPSSLSSQEFCQPYCLNLSHSQWNIPCPFILLW